MQGKKTLRLVASVTLLISILACGSADEDDPIAAEETAADPAGEPSEEGAGGDPLAYEFGGYHCDLRTGLIGRGSCEDPSVINLALGIELGERACNNRQGVWGSGECPSEGRLGTCMTSGGARTHYYAAEHTAESAESACRTFSLGTWTAASE